MEIQIKVEDYITPEKIGEICEDEVRAVIRGYMRNEDNFQRIVINGAYYLVQKCIDEELHSKGETFEEILKKEVARVVGAGLNSWDVFRYAEPHYRVANIGAQLLEEAIRDNKKNIDKAVEDAIANYPFDEVRAEIADACYAILERKLLGGAVNEN
jgi:hypothetical protein